jgi:hypothetical protein
VACVGLVRASTALVQAPVMQPERALRTPGGKHV